MTTVIKIPIVRSTEGIYLRWYFNGWHYFNFQNGYEISMKTESVDVQVTKMFSRISKIERPTKLKAEYSYQITLDGIMPSNIAGFTGLLQAEKVEQYEDSVWREVKITRGSHLIRSERSPGYILTFEITRKELPNTAAVFQTLQYLYIGSTLADLDDDEIVPINKQVNDIAEMQDRQSDFTSQFRIRKTRLMRELFELSGEVGATTDFPYKNQTAKLIQESIEIISNGKMILDKSDGEYYNVSIYSGNLNFFTELEKKKLSDLSLTLLNHNWNAAVQAASHASDLGYLYPLCEPSDDGGIAPLTDDGTTVDMYGGWVWPFIKIKAIWDEIILNSGFSVEGDILTNSVFNGLYMPIATLNPGSLDKYLISIYNNATKVFSGFPISLIYGGFLISGDPVLGNIFITTGNYSVIITGTYKLKVTLIIEDTITNPDITATDTVNAVTLEVKSETILTGGRRNRKSVVYEGDLDSVSGRGIKFYIQPCTTYNYDISFVSIENAKIGYGSDVYPKLNLPDMSQVDFIKMICNLFCLIPDADGREKKIKFWSLNEVYDNIGLARDWSNFLSEAEDENEYKFGDYAQNNYFKYEDSDDVKKDTGKGNMQVEDDTLPYEKDLVSVPVATSDAVKILTDVIVSRIAFNKWNTDTSVYDQNESIDPRLVYIKTATGKTFGIQEGVGTGTIHDVTDPKYASPGEVSFPYLITNYAALSRMLTKTNLRRAKFNLPVYEVAGIKHYIPIYLRQYKAYFYVNKINNYVPGKLCVIDLIEL